MSEPRRIFISHNSAASDETKALVEQLVATLDARKTLEDEQQFVTLVDSRLPGGEEWRSILYNWMFLCDCAVILLDEHSKNSLWVPREAMVFSWRRELDPAFKVFVILRGVKKEVFDDRAFKEMNLSEDTYFTEMDKLVETLTQLADCACDEHMNTLAGFLGTGEPAQRENVIGKARGVLGLNDRLSFVGGLKAERQIAATMLAYGLREKPFPGYENFPSVTALEIFSESLQPKGLQQSFNLLFPGWVDRRDVASFYRAIIRGEAGVVAVRMHLDVTTWPADFLRSYYLAAYSRKFPRPKEPRRVPGASLRDLEEDRLTATRKRIHAVLWQTVLRESAELRAQEIEHMKNVLEKMKPVFLWTTQDDGLLPEDLVAIQAELPSIRIFYLYRDDASISDVDGVYYLETVLSEEAGHAVELAAKIEIDYAKAQLEL